METKKFIIGTLILRCPQCIQKALLNRQLVILFLRSKEKTQLDLITQKILSYEQSEEEISH